MLNVLKQCLDSKSMTSVDDGRGCDGASLMNLRNTAAMCVVIIHEARLSLGLNEDECDHELNITERRFHQGMKKILVLVLFMFLGVLKVCVLCDPNFFLTKSGRRSSTI
mmetsp:Transcript_10566/g.10652  ORF Transcript_10566/g.10652 Transcript_10566/m.10652 type:complete len:109 (-) Transcript_10566:122-448(-)